MVGATGSIGQLVVVEARRRGFAVRALVRRPASAKHFPAGVETVIGDVTVPDTLAAAVEDVAAIVFTLGSDGEGKVGARTVDYGGVPTFLRRWRGGASASR